MSLSGTHKIQGDNLIKCWPYFEKLRKLEFRNYSGINFESVAECIGLCSNLKELNISKISGASSDFIKSFTSLMNLESLDISRNVLSNKCCRYIGTNLLELKILKMSRCKGVSFKGIKSICNLEKLEELDLSVCEEITDSELELISKLPRLQVLDIGGIDNVTGKGFVGFSSLKKLECHLCRNLEDFGLINLLKCATNLEKLDIGHCEKITDCVIDSAIEVTKKRTNNIVLEVIIYDVDINYEKMKTTSPLLHLDHFTD